MDILLPGAVLLGPFVPSLHCEVLLWIIFDLLAHKFALFWGW